MPVATRSTRDGAAETSTPPPATASDESVLDDPAGGGDSTSPVFSPTRGVKTTLALPALTQLKTRTGIVQLHQFNGEDLADFITSMLDPSDIKTQIRDLLGDVRGQVQMDITSSIAEITTDAIIKKRIKDMSDSSMRSIATFLPAIFRELLKKAVREAAPIIPAHFNLVMPGSKEDLITAPARTAIDAMLKLLPHYTELKLIKDRIEKNKDSSSKIQDRLERLDILVSDDDADSIFAFDATGYWDEKEAEKLYRNVMPKLTAFAKKYSIKEEIEVIECFNEWHLLADDFEDQDDVSCAAKFKAIHAEKRRQQYTKQLTSLIAKRKEMIASMKSVREEIAKKDVSSAPSVAAVAASDDRILKKPVLVLNLDALKGNPSPKTLIAFMKLCVNYFDQNPGSFTLLRIIMQWIFDEYNAGNTTITVPTVDNDYRCFESEPTLGITFQFLCEESLSMMQVVKSTSNYNSLIESCAELIYTNKRTDSPEMIAAEKTCFASLFRYLALRHGGNATIVGKQLKLLLQNLSGLLANKKSVTSLRTFMKDIIRPAKKMHIKIDWEDSVFTLLNALSEQSTSIFNVILDTFRKPTPEQRHNALPVLENLVAHMIATLDENRLGDSVIFDATKFQAQTINYMQATQTLADIEKHEVDVNLVIKTDVNLGVGGGGVVPPAAGINAVRQTGNNTREEARAKTKEEVKQFLATNPDQATIIRYCCSDKCSHHVRHKLVESIQPISSSKWICQAADCNVQVSNDMVERMKKIRLSESGIPTYWKWAACNKCFITNLYQDLTAKTSEPMYKAGNQARKNQERQITSGRFGEQGKQLMAALKNKGPDTGESRDAAAGANTVSADLHISTEDMAEFERLKQLHADRKAQPDWASLAALAPRSSTGSINS